MRSVLKEDQTRTGSCAFWWLHARPAYIIGNFMSMMQPDCEVRGRDKHMMRR